MVLALIPVIACNTVRKIVLGVMLVLAIGIAIELTQLYIPTRYADVTDALFNVMGVSIGTMIGLSLRSTYQSLIPALNAE